MLRAFSEHTNSDRSPQGSPDGICGVFLAGVRGNFRFLSEAMSAPRNIIFRYSLPVATVGLTVLIRAAVNPWLHCNEAVSSFTVAVLISGLFAGVGPCIVAIGLSLLSSLMLLKLPEGTNLTAYGIIFLVVSAVTLYIAHACRSLRKSEEAACKALEQREEQLRIAIEALPLGVAFTDQAGRITTVNQAAREMWGGMRYLGVEDYDKFRLFRSGRRDPVPLQDTPHFRALQGETVLNEVFDIENSDGKMRTVTASSIPLKVGDGPVFGVVSVGEDITQRRSDMEELRRAKEVAEAASLAKGRFLAVLSHELRTPLTPVLMLSENMEANTDLPSRVREDAGMIRCHVTQEARLIDDLLDLTRIERGKFVLDPRRVDIHELLRSAVEMLQPEAQGKGVGISMDFLARRHHVNADRARIRQVIWNLLGNGLKFTPPGGCISVITEDATECFIQISVRDTGIGISPEALPTVFKAFEQGDTDHRRFGGLGLGLSIARALVKMHRGEIEVTSPGLGHGTTVAVTLPALDEEQRIEAAPLIRKETVASHLRILLVEDHEPTALVLARLLKRRGHEIRVAGSVAEALSNGDFQIDLLVSDIGLPDGSGIDVIRHFRAAAWEFRAIALSGFGMEQDVEVSLAAGFDRHLIKPVDFGSLEAAIESLFPKTLS